jgi:hypothetical protein
MRKMLHFCFHHTEAKCCVSHSELFTCMFAKREEALYTMRMYTERECEAAVVIHAYVRVERVVVALC